MEKRSLVSRIVKVKELGVIGANIVVCLAFTAVKPQYFASADNFINIVYYGIPLAFVTLAMVAVLVVAEVDLSVGSTYALTSCFLAVITNGYVNVWVGTILTLAFGAALGFINGIVTVKTGIPSLIITLGTQLLYATGALLISGGSSIQFKGQGGISSLYGRTIGGFAIGSRTQLPGIPTMVFWVVGAGILFYILLNHTKFGNWMIAVGDRPWAALTSGIPVARVKVISFMICSTLTTFAAILVLSQVEGASPISGTLLPFQGIGAAVIGGTSLFGGSGAIVGAILGAVLMGMIQDGVQVVGMSAFYYEGAIGAVVIIAALVNIFLKRGERR